MSEPVFFRAPQRDLCGGPRPYPRVLGADSRGGPCHGQRRRPRAVSGCERHPVSGSGAALPDWRPARLASTQTHQRQTLVHRRSWQAAHPALAGTRPEPDLAGRVPSPGGAVWSGNATCIEKRGRGMMETKGMHFGQKPTIRGERTGVESDQGGTGTGDPTARLARHAPQRVPVGLGRWGIEEFVEPSVRRLVADHLGVGVATSPTVRPRTRPATSSTRRQRTWRSGPAAPGMRDTTRPTSAPGSGRTANSAPGGRPRTIRRTGRSGPSRLRAA